MKKRMLAVLLALAMAAALLPAVALANDTGSGTAADPFTTVKAYNNAIYSSSSKTWNLNWCGKDIYLIINGGEFYQGDFNLRNTQSLANPPQLHLIIRNARFTGNTAGDGDMTGKGNPSFMYLANCKSLVIDNCIFDTGTSGLKYGINWNLCGIQNATVSITNCTFTGTFTKNALKLNQRNGSDDAAGDVKGDQNATWTWQGDYWIKDDGITRVYPSTIASATIANCTFSGNNAVIALGTQGKGQSGA